MTIKNSGKELTSDEEDAIRVLLRVMKRKGLGVGTQRATFGQRMSLADGTIVEHRVQQALEELDRRYG